MFSNPFRYFNLLARMTTLEEKMSLLTTAVEHLTTVVKNHLAASQKLREAIALYLQNNNPNDDSVAAGVIETAVKALNDSAVAEQAAADTIQSALDHVTAVAPVGPATVTLTADQMQGVIVDALAQHAAANAKSDTAPVVSEAAPPAPPVPAGTPPAAPPA